MTAERNKQIEVVISDAFESLVEEWSYKITLSIGSYGSGKSHHIALKIILKCLKEKRKVLVVREVYESLRESCFDLMKSIITDMGLLEDNPRVTKSKSKVLFRDSGMKFKFPNGSLIIFKGLDNLDKAKSIHGVSIVWIEECAEIKQRAFLELLGRVRAMGGCYFFLTCNPVSTSSWVYTYFFIDIDNEGKPIVKVDDKELYEKGEFVKKIDKRLVYYHHSVVDNNPFVPEEYIQTLDELKEHDEDLYRTARLGRFGVSGNRVLPQFEMRPNEEVDEAVQWIAEEDKYYGLDFGFEESYNALVWMAVDKKEKILYIYDELYENHVTDEEFIKREKMQRLKRMQQYYDDKGVYYNLVVADSSAPKDIKFYNDNDIRMRKCDNRGLGANKTGTRIANTKKIKRFKKIICASRCINTNRELSTLTFHKDKNGKPVYDKFNIDPHTFSAIWYGLDKYTVADLKEHKNGSW